MDSILTLPFVGERANMARYPRLLPHVRPQAINSKLDPWTWHVCYLRILRARLLVIHTRNSPSESDNPRLHQQSPVNFVTWIAANYWNWWFGESKRFEGLMIRKNGQRWDDLASENLNEIVIKTYGLIKNVNLNMYLLNITLKLEIN